MTHGYDVISSNCSKLKSTTNSLFFINNKEKMNFYRIIENFYGVYVMIIR